MVSGNWHRVGQVGDTAGKAGKVTNGAACESLHTIDQGCCKVRSRNIWAGDGNTAARKSALEIRTRLMAALGREVDKITREL